MIIDTTLKTVTFPAGDTLTVDQLWTLIDLLDHENITITLKEPEVRDEPQFEKTYSVQSDKTYGLYYAVVQFPDFTWACSCPDWINRRSENGTNCKHINRLTHPGWAGWSSWIPV